MIRRHFDAELHNRIANHPEVRPTFGYHEGPTDLTPLIDHPDRVVLLSDGEGVMMIFEWSAPGVWQGHIAVLPQSRGRKALNSARQMCRYIFDEHEARLLWVMAPVRLPKIGLFSRLVGFKPEGEITNAADDRCKLFVMEKP